MPSSDAKTAEFARLFDLFDRLASRRARATGSTGDRDTSMTDLRTIPEDFSTVLKNLSTIAGARKPRPEYTTNTRPRRNTVAFTSRRVSDMAASDESSVSDNDDEESFAKFPLADEKNYPFTFKHMVHKLYRKDDWARTVKEMLEKSKNEFKSLAEQDAAAMSGKAADERDDDAMEEQKAGTGGVIRFKLATSPGVGRRGSVVGTRQRSHSVAGAGPRVINPSSPVARSPGSCAQPEVRALKKRCVGRRKSMSGPLNAGAGDAATGRTTRGTWVYAAAISSAEHPAAATFSSFPPAPPPSPTGKTSFSRYQPMGAMKENMPSTLQGAGIGMKRRVSTGGQGTMMPLQHVTNRNSARLMVRKRAATVYTTEDCGQETQVKHTRRPFSFSG